jgi:hypothetical protein
MNRVTDCGRWQTLAALGTGLLLVTAGCWSQSTKPVASSGPAKSGAAAATAGAQCESVLSSIEDIFRLSSLGRTTAVSDGVARLNDWSRSCGPAADVMTLKLPDDVRRLISDEEIAAMKEPRFLPRDGEHLRDSMLERAVSTYAFGNGQTELERVVNIFGHIVRAVGLVRQPLQDLPLSSYEVYLFGKGTAEDRAWIFVNVLRQLKLDGVLLFPQPSETGQRSDLAAGPFLVGALLDGRTYLFDPMAGVAIPWPATETGDSSASRVATLADAVSDPAVLKQLDAGAEKPYPIRAADLARPRVAIVGDTSLWSPRMQALQSEFVGNRAMIISDPLADSAEAGAGLWSRVLDAGKERWNAADMFLWDYPERRLKARVRMSDDQQGALTGLLKPFDAYMNVRFDSQAGRFVLETKELRFDKSATEFDPGVHINVRTTVGEQMRARLAHLEGDFATAVKGYMDVRGRSNEVLKTGPILPIQSMHTQAIDDASYWAGLCKFEQGEFRAAIDNLNKYRKRPDPEKWDRESRYILALSLAASGNREAAIRELEGVEPDDPEYFGYRCLIGQWREAPTTAGKCPGT